MEPAAPSSGSAQQLELLRQRLQQGNPELYRHWALYLQVLREGLGQAVDQACFHLAVTVHPLRYQGLEASRRLEFHRRMARLVQRSRTLLTVEQLRALSRQMQQRQRRETLRARREWLEALQASTRESADPSPQGSVKLGMALPISSNVLGIATAPLAGSFEKQERQEPPAAHQEHQEHQEHPQSAADLMAAFAGLLDVAEPPPSDDDRMPADPVALLAWIDGLEAALARRLRTLSHALNVELVRVGLCSTLLPLRLLEAVAAGQIDSQATAANLVALSLPVPDSAQEAALETQALLLRPVDLEAEQPKLRTCRARLQQALQELRRMAHTYQRLEQRLQIQQAEQLWLNDHSTAQRPQTPGSSAS